MEVRKMLSPCSVMVVRLLADVKKGKGKAKAFEAWPHIVQIAWLKEVLDKVP